VGLLFSVLLLAGCSTAAVTGSPIYNTVTQPALQPGDPIPEPQEQPILTVSGLIGAPNAGDTIVMDRATIEQVGVVEYSVHDPFADHEVSYRGVLMRDLLALWQIPETVKTAHLVALNDYAVDVPIEDFYDYPVLFALQADGVYMEPDYQGPAMLVYPVDDYEFDLITIRRRWIWQINRIELQ
jgi:hypothetical protein